MSSAPLATPTALTAVPADDYAEVNVSFSFRRPRGMNAYWWSRAQDKDNILGAEWYLQQDAAFCQALKWARRQARVRSGALRNLKVRIVRDEVVTAKAPPPSRFLTVPPARPPRKKDPYRIICSFHPPLRVRDLKRPKLAAAFVTKRLQVLPEPDRDADGETTSTVAVPRIIVVDTDAEPSLPPSPLALPPPAVPSAAPHPSSSSSSLACPSGNSSPPPPPPEPLPPSPPATSPPTRQAGYGTPGPNYAKNKKKREKRARAKERREAREKRRHEAQVRDSAMGEKVTGQV
ncbi:hypothetical protein JCM10213v2_008732 [Rhodosporidiobolus nylandii]